jgi:hypothetical protein
MEHSGTSKNSKLFMKKQYLMELFQLLMFPENQSREMLHFQHGGCMILSFLPVEPKLNAICKQCEPVGKSLSPWATIVSPASILLAINLSPLAICLRTYAFLFASRYTYHSLQDIQTEEGAGKDHLSEMRINNEDRSDPHNETAGRPGGLPYMIRKGGVVM